jgi:uncharacterized protein YcfJ
MKMIRIMSVVTTSILIASCAETPMGPTVQVMPAPNKPFNTFQEDQILCKNYAEQQVSGQAQQANERAIGAGLLGTALGTAVGAAATGGSGRGLATGAAVGAVGGTALGMGSSYGQQGGIQVQYNNAYSQCMYSKGNQVPGFAPAVAAPLPPPQASAPPPPPPSGSVPPPPPPPAGYYSPPPSR